MRRRTDRLYMKSLGPRERDSGTAATDSAALLRNRGFRLVPTSGAFSEPALIAPVGHLGNFRAGRGGGLRYRRWSAERGGHTLPAPSTR
jgi:hypothetical protein